MTKEISQLTPKGAVLSTTDLLEVSVSDGMGGYITKSETGSNIIDSIPNVTFQNDYYITDNGNDSTGNGSLSKPFLTAPHTLAVILALSPSSSNKFFIHDERNSDITENIQLIPFVCLVGNGNPKWTGNISLHSSFGSISSDSFSTFGGYKEWVSGSTLTLNFSGFSLTHQILINLFNIPKAPITYSIIGNDGANFNADTFRVNEINFNTAGRNADNSYWQANTTVSSGITRRIRYCEGWQCSSITKSLGLVPAVTLLDVQFCGEAVYQISIGTLAIINSGGASNQPEIKVNISACNINGTTLNLDITNDGSSFVDFTLDTSVFPTINSANSLTNIFFNNFMYSDLELSQYTPVNFTATSWTDPGGILINGGTYGSMLKGIDDKLAIITTTNFSPGYIHGFQLTWNSVGPPATITIGTGFGADSTNSFNMSLNSPVTLDTTSASIDNGASWSSGSWYAIWLYEKSSDFTTTMKFSLSFSSPAAISGYDKVRLVGSVKGQTIGTNIMSIVQKGISNDRTYYWNDGDTSLILLTSGSAVITAPGTFSCSAGQSPISNEIDMQYQFTPGVARAGDNFSISNADFSGLALVYYSGLVASLISTGRVGFLPTNSSQNLSYFVDNASDDLELAAIAYKESL